ncbi:unnamed protein product [Acanthoscelides obtectus]|nr:unnamed protein product [Acanthoscelides obtectus]CAK1635718.1 Valacyclovir hydrolase [Acanthoscelides obtectus]
MLITKNFKIYKFSNLFKTYGKAMSTVKEQKINVNGQTINYAKVGEGSKTVLCCPGALGSIWTDFKPQVEGLDKNKLTVIAWDPPGYGHSRPPERHFDVNFYEKDADTALNFMKALGYDKFSILGWSDGGNSGMILAAKYPKNVEKLIMWGVNSYILPEEVKIYEKMRDISNWSDRMKAPLIELYTENGLEKMWYSWCDTLIEMARNGGDICKNKLADIRCPTFILHGDKDPKVAPEHPGYLFSNIRMAK